MQNTPKKKKKVQNSTVGLCYQWLNGCSSERAEPEVPEDAERAAGTEPTQVWHNSNVSGGVHVHILSVHNKIYCVCGCGVFLGCLHVSKSVRFSFWNLHLIMPYKSQAKHKR